jgi:tellurite resistance protein
MAPQNVRRPSPMSPAQLRQAHHTYLEEMLFDAVVTAGAVVALADGQVDPEERARVADLVERSGWLSTYTAAEAADAFDSRVRQLELEGGVPETALNSVRRVGDGLGSRVVVCAAEQVARADGRIQLPEERALGLIRSALAPSTEQAARPACPRQRQA